MMATSRDGLVLDSAPPQGVQTPAAGEERQQALRAALLDGPCEGYEETMLQALTSLYETRLGHMPEVVHSSLEATSDVARLPRLLPVFVSGDAEAIARAVLLN